MNVTEDWFQLKLQLADMSEKLASDSIQNAFVLCSGDSTPRKRDHDDKVTTSSDGDTGRCMSTFYTPKESNTPSTSSGNSTPHAVHEDSDENAMQCTPAAAPLTQAPRLMTPTDNSANASQPSSPSCTSDQYDLQSAVTNGDAAEKVAAGSQDGSETEHSYEPVTIGAQIEPEIATEIEREIATEAVPEVKCAEPSLEEDEHDIYHTPRSNAPVNKLPSGILFQVEASHPYAGEDVDELSFEPGHIINVIAFDDPEDQDEGWLMGVKVEGGERGVFPENFTKPV